MELKETIEDALFDCGNGKQFSTNQCSEMAEEIVQAIEDADIRICTATERAFLDEIREKGGSYRTEESGFIDSGICIEDSILRQHDFECNLQELMEGRDD